jgi:ubiquinone/menaquinone biosynthesis C-methylase UbiE
MKQPREPRPDWYRTAFDEIYPVLYAHRTQKEAVDFIARLSDRLDLGGGRVLDLGCGTGRYLRAISDRGLCPIGLDLSLPLLEITRSRLPQVPLVRADMRRLPIRDRSFRGVLLMFTTFGYFHTREEDVSVLREVARVIDADGRFVFDYVNARHVREHLVYRSGRLIREMCAEERRWIDPEGPFLCKETRLGPMRDGTYRTYRERLRLYEPPQIEEMIEDAGFRITERLGDYHAAPFDPARSPRLLLLTVRGEGAR